MNKTRQHYLLTAFLMSAFVFFINPSDTLAQQLSEHLTQFNAYRILLNNKSMYILLGWAVTNMAVGSAGYFKGSGSTKYLHQMNIAWNIINLTIAGAAIHQYTSADPSALSLTESISKAHHIENILVLNIGLNVSYIAAGGFLWERGIRKTSNRLLGYGQSLIIQGSFLLLFDSTLYLLNHSHNDQLMSFINYLSIKGTQLSSSVHL